MIGQKGVPATHGGVERHVEELGARLASLGHEVTVFTRPGYTDRHLTEYRGMRLRSLPTIGTKHLDAIVHSVLATLVCWRGGFDIVHYHAIGPCLASPLARIRGLRVVATIHGQDWRRGKWGPFATTLLRLAEWMALNVPNATVCVSESLTDRYRSETGREVIYIPNGIAIDPGDDTRVLSGHGLVDGQYLFFAGRLVPEKGAHYLIAAYQGTGIEMPLVIAGDTSMSDSYVLELRASGDDRVLFVGYQYGARLAALFRHAALFVLPSDVEGLPIVLLEALAYGAPVLASDIPPNVEVLGDDGMYFRAGDVQSLRGALAQACGSLPALRERVIARQGQDKLVYDWEAVAVATSELYERVGRL
jgi:glycosyltransferase involved in cell wall biosynthesis